MAEDTDGLRTAGCPSGLETKIVPLPVYSTLPNEGSTFGTMPVFLRVCEANGRTNSIIAPSVTWNDVIHATGTFRVFHYPSEDKTLTFIASLSTRIDSGLLLVWQDLPRALGTTTSEVEVRLQRSVFYRFFGLGPDTPPEAESSYTRVRGHAVARPGLGQPLLSRRSKRAGPAEHLYFVCGSVPVKAGALLIMR